MLAAVLGLTGSGCVGDHTPYVWPTPPYGVPETAKVFKVRTNPWQDTPEQIRDVIARQCGPDYDTARIFPHPATGTLLHPDQLTVVCGNPPAPEPEFRGQRVNDNYLLSLKPPG